MESGIFSVQKRAISLTKAGAHLDLLERVRRGDLDFGDRLFVQTRNSLYTLCRVADGLFRVSGGWFDKNRPDNAVVGINGCTWGGAVIATDTVAAPGLFLEFSNGVTTTRIRKVWMARSEGNARIN